MRRTIRNQEGYIGPYFYGVQGIGQNQRSSRQSEAVYLHLNYTDTRGSREGRRCTRAMYPS